MLRHVAQKAALLKVAPINDPTRSNAFAKLLLQAPEHVRRLHLNFRRVGLGHVLDTSLRVERQHIAPVKEMGVDAVRKAARVLDPRLPDNR